VSIVVTGSIAFDYIMDFPGYFKDHILPDKVHVLSVSFLVETMRKMRGGTAGNIAYNLALLGEAPRVLATVGEDFGDYRQHLAASGVDTSLIREVAGEYTALAFITTDRADNQITGFYPGAMRRAGELSLADLVERPDLVIVAPNAPEAMARYPAECRARGVPYVFDPGQGLPMLSGEQLVACIRGARCVIGNDYEMALIAEKTGYTPEALRELAEVVIVTRGEHGSTIYDATGRTDIPVAPPRQVVDPTGAGDAYRAGVLWGLLRGEPAARYGRVASLAATYAVEVYGTQEHRYTPAEFAARFREAFGEAL
jgi:adenosine kinase